MRRTISPWLALLVVAAALAIAWFVVFKWSEMTSRPSRRRSLYMMRGRAMRGPARGLPRRGRAGQEVGGSEMGDREGGLPGEGEE